MKDRIKNMSDIARTRMMLVIAVTVMFVIAYWGYIFGGRYLLFKDAGMDTICQFYPMYIHVIDSIKEGTLSLWNFEWGLGCDTLTRQEWIMDPCAWVIIGTGVVFGVETVKNMLLVMQFVKIMACALICFEFLKYYGASVRARFIASCLFAFNGWIMLWGQHYYFGMACVYLILLLLLVEKLIAAYQEQRAMKRYYLAVGITVALIFIYSVYFGYMIAIFTSVYTILRMMYVDGVKTLWHRLWPVIVTVVLGMLCAACMIVPYADIVLNVSTRVEGSLWHRLSQYLSLTYGMNYYKVLAGRIISDNTFGILGIDQKYYEFPQLSFSVLGAIVLPQAVWYGIIKDRNNVERRKWILRIVMLILMVAAVTVPMAGAIFNIGCESLVEGIPAMRFTYVLMPLMAVIYALFIDRCVERNDINRWLASAGVLFVILINYYAFRHYRLQYKWINIAIIVLNIAVIGIHYTTGKVRIMLGLLIAGACFEGYVTNNVRYTYDRTTECINSTDFHGRDTTHILEYLKEHDDSFYRVEKTYHDFSATGDSLLQNYAPVSMYCSTMSGSLKTFYEKMYPTEEYRYIKHDLDGALYDDAFAITNTKYILSWTKLDWDYLEEIYEYDGTYVYRNLHAGSIASLYYDGKEADRTSHFVRKTDACVEGSVDAKEDGTLMLAIPYRKGWNVYVDGVRQQIREYDYAFIATDIEAGQHTVVAKYENRLYVIGALLSLAGVVMFAGWVVKLC